MGHRGPKPLSAAILKARGSGLAAVRAKEERQRHGWEAPSVPQVYPLPRTLSKAARQWGTQLMTEAVYDATEAKMLIEMLSLWDRCQGYKRFLAANGPSIIDKNGIPHERPEHRMLRQELTLLLRYTHRLQVKEPR